MAVALILGLLAGVLAGGALAAGHGRGARDATSASACQPPTVQNTSTTTVTRVVTTTTKVPAVPAQPTGTVTTPTSTTTTTATTPTGSTTTPTGTGTTTGTTTTATSTGATATTATSAGSGRVSVPSLHIKRVKLVRHFQTIGSPWVLPHDVSRVSNGYTDTVVAESGGTGPVYGQPDRHARVIAHLRLNTPDDEALQSYLVVGQRTIHHVAWVLIDVPMRPNGTLGWVPRSALGSYIESDEQIIVDRAAHTLYLCKAGREIFHSPIGVGRPSMVTPTGRFWVTEAFLSTDPEYGPWAFGTSDLATMNAVHAGFGDGGMVGIHGTNKPWLIPGNPSHGCVRLPNADILRLEQLVGIGASIWVQ